MKFGVLGYGKIVREQLAPAFRQAGHPIVSIGSRSATRPQGFLGEVHSDYQACIDDPQVEAIYIATPNHLHTPLAVAAMQAGKPVLCEKPIAQSWQEFETLENAQARYRATLMEALMVEHHPQWQQFRALNLGQQRTIQTSFTYGPRKAHDVRSKADLGGGVWLDIGCYTLFTCYASGARTLSSIQGQAINENGVPVRVMAQLEFDEGVTAQIQVTSQQFRQQAFSITTELGRFDMPRPFNPEGPVANTWQTDQATQALSSDANQYALMIQHFVDHSTSAEFLFQERSATLARWSNQIRQELGC